MCWEPHRTPCGNIAGVQGMLSACFVHNSVCQLLGDGCLIHVCSLDLWTLPTAQLKVIILLLQPDAWETCCSVSAFLDVGAARAREL